MRLDQQTLQDLEVHGTPSGAPDLLDYLDRTRTRGGREALRRRITQPLGSARDIVAVQESLRFIASNRRAFDPLPDDANTTPLKRYLDSRFTTLKSVTGPGLAFESLWVRQRYPELYRVARRGTRLAAKYLERLSNVLDLVAESSESMVAPAPLGDYLEEFRALLTTPGLAPLREPARRWFATPSIFVRDHAAREVGRSAFARLIDVASEIDALVSMSDATSELGYVFPDVDEAYEGIELRDLRHPFLSEATSNDFAMPSDGRVLFLTGPNMAGKSTYLKTAGIAVLLAHAGMAIPASAGRLGLFQRLITAIRTEDDLRAGVSYFQAEARRVREIAKLLTSGARCLVIADELFRGTNVKDACDASLTVLTAFAATPHGRFLVASHLTELAQDLRHVTGVLFRRFEAEVTDQTLAFDYRLRDGVSGQRLGMHVLKSEGVLEVLALMRAASAPDERSAQGA